MVGEEHDAGVCIIFVEAPPGRGPALHRHPYEEIFIVQEGEALFVADGEERTVRAGEIELAQMAPLPPFADQLADRFHCRCHPATISHRRAWSMTCDVIDSRPRPPR